MMNRRRTLPPVSPKTPSEIRPLISAITEIIETGEGVRGNPMDRKITARDLVDSGIGKIKPGARPGASGSISPGDSAPPDMSIPPAPQGFAANGAFNGMMNLSWTIPAEIYGNHGLTRIYRAEEDNFANAKVVGAESGAFFTDRVRNDVADPNDPTKAKGYYYWIAFVSIAGVEGPPNAPGGTYAAPLLDAGYIIEQITGDIDEGVLAPSLKDEIDRIGPIEDRFPPLESAVDKIPPLKNAVEKIPPLQSAVDDLDQSTTQRIDQERADRIEAMQTERSQRIQGVADEAQARKDALSSQRDDWLAKIAEERGNIDTVIAQKERESHRDDEYLAAMQRVIAATKDTTSASIYSMEQVRATEDAALASRMDLMSVEIDGNSADIIKQSDVFADAVSAVSKDVTNLATEVDGNRGLITEESQTRSDVVSSLSTQIGVISAKLDALPTFANGFEPGPEFSRWSSPAGHTLAQDAGDAFSGLQAGLVSSSSASVDTSSAPFAVHAVVPEGSASTFLGKRLRVSIAAKKPSSSAAPEFAIGYAVGSAWFSDWQSFAPAADWTVHEAMIDVPGDAAGDHYVAIWGDTSGAGSATLVDRVLVEAIQSEIPEVTAALEDLRQAYTQADQALAEDIQTMGTRVDDANSTIQQKAQALSDDISSVTTQLNEAVSQVGDDIQSAVTEERNTSASETEAVANRVDDVKATVDGFDARITNEEEVRAEEDELSGRIQRVMSAARGASSSTTFGLEEVRSTESEALAKQIDGLQVRFDDSRAMAQVERRARISDSRAAARQISEVQSDLDGDLATVRQDFNTEVDRIDGDVQSASQAATDVQTNLEDGLSGVRQDFNTEVNRIDGNVTANAQANTSLRSDLDDATATITEEQETSASRDEVISRIQRVVAASRGAASASLLSFEEIRITDSEALAKQIDGVLLEVQENRAMAEVDRRARISDSQSTAQQVATVQAELEGDLSTVRQDFNAEVERIDGNVSSNTQAVTDVQSSLDDAISDVRQDFGAQVDRVDGNITANAQALTDIRSQLDGTTAGIRQDFNTEVSRIDGNVTANAQAINTAETELGDNIAAVQTNLETNIQRVDGELESIGARYTAQVEANGLIGGFGIYNDGTEVEAGFDVDSFWIGRTDDNKRKPFIIDDGTTFIDEAMIRDASIQEGQLGPITIGKLEQADGTPITTVGGLIRSDAIDVNNLRVAEAARFSGDVSSSNFKSGSRGWLIRQDGYVELNEAMIRGNLEIDSITVNGEPPFSGIDKSGSSRKKSLKVGYQATNIDYGDYDAYTTSYQTSVSKAPKNSKVSITAYPKMELRMTDGWSMGGAIRHSVYMRVRIWVNGSLQHNKNTRMAYRAFGYNLTYTHPSYSSGIPITYTFPSYSGWARIKMELRVELKDPTYKDGSYGYGHFYAEARISGNNVISGKLSRLG